jgi:hypothetical protein
MSGTIEEIAVAVLRVCRPGETASRRSRSKMVVSLAGMASRSMRRKKHYGWYVYKGQEAD